MAGKFSVSAGRPRRMHGCCTSGTQGSAVAMLRPAYITDADTLVDKYGVKRPSVNWQFIDRRDIGAAVDCALCLPDLGCETFSVLGHPDSARHADMEQTQCRLGWKPVYDFFQYPDDPS